MPTASLDGKILLRSYRIGYRRTLEWSPDIEAPQFLERLIVVSNDPAVLQRREQHATCCIGGAGSNFDIGNGLGDDFMVDCIEGRYGTVIKVTVVIALLTVLLVQPAIGRKERVSRTVLGEASFDP